METLDLDKVASKDSRLLLYRCVADVIAENNLKYVNEKDHKVKIKTTFYTKYIKRIIDVIVSSVALIVVAPINLLIGVITLFDVGWPIIFFQKRVGKDGKLFTIIKFRNMTNEKDENGDLLPPYKRVTKFGGFVRKTSLDELLNFWSIFVGDMSVIGPRPLDPLYESRYSDRHKQRVAVKPGLECPLIEPGNERKTWGDQFDNDIYYVENISFSTDMKMIVGLFKMVFDSDGTSIRGKSVRGSFMGYDREGNTINSIAVPVEYVELALKKMKNMKEEVK